MTNIQAALGLSQLRNIKNIVKKKIEIGKRYYKALNLNKNIQMLPPSNSYSKNIYWVVGILIKNKKINIKNVVNKLLSFGIQTRPFFWPMNEQNIFKKLKIFSNKNNKYPNSKYLSRNGLYLPSYLKLENKEIDYICDIVNKVIK
jgi:perosamine synthetase